MGSRLALASASLLIALVLDALGGNITITEWEGFYGIVALSFLATLVYRPFLGRVHDPRRFAAVNIATDIGLVSGMVVFSGGGDSVFTFLYMTVAIYAAMFFRRFEALGWGVGAGLAYGAVLLAGVQGLFGMEAGGSAAALWTTWVVHTGALVLVAALTSFLAAELERTGQALHQRTHALFRLQNLHQRTVESLVSGLLTTDRQGRITSFNAEAERITGVARKAALELEAEEILPGVQTLIEAAGDDVQRSRARMSFRDPQGRALHLGVGTYILRDAHGAPSGHVVIFQDVTDVVKMERELRRSERLAAVGELSASIAHEIRNPLAAISGSIQVMQGRLKPAEAESARLMNIVIREVDRLNHLITDFLDFARPGPAKIESVSMHAIVAEVAQMFEPVRPEGVRLAIEVPEALQVAADAGQLRQVIWNLVLNAGQAMPDGGEIRIEARAIDDEAAQGGASGDRLEAEHAIWAEVSVLDQGVGIPPEVADQIFDPFFTTRRDGSGLGLPTVHRIVEDHGGTVRIDRPDDDFVTAIRVRLRRAGACT
jgi:two-component system sensor histidine kinase PilS (NtrC family)